MDENVKFVPKEINPPNVSRHVRLRIFGTVWHKKFTREAQTEQQLVRRIECKMKEFDTNSVESLFEGVKAKVKSIGDNGLYALFK